MDKPYPNNAFTLIEMLVVLLIISLFSIQFYIPKDSLTLFMQKMMTYSIICQEKAFSQKQEVDVSIYSKEATFGNIEFDYPDSITCTGQSFHYNAKGNISKAGSVTCSNGKTSQKMVFQLGSGRVRIDE